MSGPGGLYDPNAAAKQASSRPQMAGPPLALAQPLSALNSACSQVREATVDEVIRNNIAELHEQIRFQENLYEEARRMGVLNFSMARLRTIVGM